MNGWHMLRSLTDRRVQMVEEEKRSMEDWIPIMETTSTLICIKMKWRDRMCTRVCTCSADYVQVRHPWM